MRQFSNGVNGCRTQKAIALKAYFLGFPQILVNPELIAGNVIYASEIDNRKIIILVLFRIIKIINKVYFLLN